jgi:hypothetical protein
MKAKRRSKPRPPEQGRGGPNRATYVPRLGSLAIALSVLVVYLIQCPTVSGDKDSAEFTLVLALNGVAHPTGYPIYTLLGHLFVRAFHALGATWAYAANAWTALGGGAAIYFLHRLAISLPLPSPRLDRRASFLLALLPVGLFAFNPIWTYETSLAEVYSWHIAWVLGTSLFFVRLVRELATEGPMTARQLHLRAALWGLICGVGGAHHATSIFVAAPLSIALLVVLAGRRRLSPGLVATVLAATCAPLLSYGIILWRASHPAAYQWPGLAPGLGGLLSHVTGKMYQGYLGHFAPSDEQRRFLLWYVYPFLFPGLLLALLNALRARVRTERALQWGLTASALLGTGYAFSYGAYDPSSYFLQPMTLGLVAITPLLASFVRGGVTARRTALACGAALAVAGLVLSVPWLRTGQQRTGLYVSFDQLVHRMWMAIPADSGIVFWTNDMYTKLSEYQLLQGEKPGLTAVHGLTIYTEPVRRPFIRRYGFDPVAGIQLSPSTRGTLAAEDSVLREAVDSAESHVNGLTSLPVIHFDPDPARPSMRLLMKPRADTSDMPIARARLPFGATVQRAPGRR